MSALSANEMAQAFDQCVARIAREYSRNARVLYVWRQEMPEAKLARIVLDWADRATMIICIVLHRQSAVPLDIETTMVRITSETWSYRGNERAAHATLRWKQTLDREAARHARTLARLVRWAFRLNE